MRAKNTGHFQLASSSVAHPPSRVSSCRHITLFLELLLLPTALNPVDLKNRRQDANLSPTTGICQKRLGVGSEGKGRIPS